MKQLLTLIILLSFILPAFSVSRYQIFKCIGDVSIVENGHAAKASPKQNVSLVTAVEIPDGAQIGILDNKTRAIFYSTSFGKTTVARILRDARKRAESKTANITRQILDNIHDSNNGKSKSKGVSYRGEAPSNIDFAISDIILNNKTTNTCPVSIKTEINPIDSTFYYVVENKSAYPIYINLVNDKRLIFGYSETPILVGHGETPFPHYVFYGPPAPDTKIIACTYPFDSNMINILLQSGEIPDHNVGDTKIWFN